MLRRWLLLTLTLSTAGQAAPPRTPPPAAPPPPASYHVTIRYSIVAYRTERLRQYDEMVSYLSAVGFKRDPAEDPGGEAGDPNATRMSGTIPAKSVSKLLRQRHARALLLVPSGSKLPDKETRVRVDIGLVPGLAPERQRELARQTAAVLAKLGFREGLAYDDRGHTRLLGSLPVGSLDALLEDVRKVPGADKEPAPFRSLPPVRVTTALPDLPLPAPRPAPPAVPAGQEKLTPDLRGLLGDADAAGSPRRLEVILGHTPTARDREWQRPFALLPDLVVEGRLGPLVTVRGTAKARALALAALPEVVAVRLPRVAQPSRPVGAEDRPEKWDPVRASGLARLHAVGARGKGTRLAVIAADFRGWETLKNRSEGKGLLPDPVLLDVTRERNADLRPDPFPAGKGALGPGTLCARAILRSAPEAELTLIRLDAAAPYMLEAVARAISGEAYRTIGLDQRFAELQLDRDLLRARREQLLEERKRVLEDFREDEEPRKRREQYQKKQAEFDRAEDAFRARLGRFFRFQRDLGRLRGIRVVACSLVWAEGHPVDGSSPLSRYLDERPLRGALWFQAAGDTRGQAWTGLFRDADGNGVMEFTAPGRPLPRGSWTPELNFLSWQGPAGRQERSLPAGTRLRLSLQWREAHEALPLRLGEDPYREPLANLRLVVVYQPDPDGKSRPADDVEVVAQSVGLPQRLAQTLNSATWEQLIELRLPRGGRYAVRVEGKAPESTLPPGEVALPATRKRSELYARLFVRTVDGGGRALIADYATLAGSLGMPADAGRVITVGAASAAGKGEPFSAGAPPFSLALLAKPEVLAYHDGLGTTEAVGFAAGLIAAARNASVPLYTCLEALQAHPGRLLRIQDARRPR